MQERRTSEFYRQLSPQDRIQFDRWLKANVAIASIFSAALVAMAFLAAPFSASGDTSAAAATRVLMSFNSASRVSFGRPWMKVTSRIIRSSV